MITDTQSLKTIKDNTALHNAVLNDDTAKLRAILAVNADDKTLVNKVNDAQLTPLHYAALLGRNKAAKILINKGADVNVQANKEYGSPLYIATKLENTELAAELVKHKASTDFKDPQGNTIRDYVKQSDNNDLKKLFDQPEPSTDASTVNEPINEAPNVPALSEESISNFKDAVRHALLKNFPYNEQGEATLTLSDISYSDGSYYLKGDIKGTRANQDISAGFNEKLTAGKDSIWKDLKHFFDLHKAKEYQTVTYTNQDGTSPHLHFKGKVGDYSFDKSFVVNADQTLTPIQEQTVTQKVEKVLETAGEAVKNATHTAFETASETLHNMGTNATQKVEEVTHAAADKGKHTYEDLKEWFFGKDKAHFHFERKESVNPDGTHNIHQVYYEKDPTHEKEVIQDGVRVSNAGEKILKNPEDFIKFEFDKVISKTTVKVTKEAHIHINGKDCYLKDIIAQDSDNVSIFDINLQDIETNCDNLQLTGLLTEATEAAF